MRTQPRVKNRKSGKNKRNRELKKELGKKLLGYSAAAGAVLTIGAGAAEAVAVKTTLGTPETVVTGGFLDIDIDGGGTDDFDFFLGSNPNEKNAGVWAGTYFSTNFNNSVLANLYAEAVSFGSSAPISSALSGVTGNHFALLGKLFYPEYGTYSYGNFVGSSGFLGVSFDIGGSTHYGWVDLALNSNATELTINGWGYETVAGVGIQAGAGEESNPVPEPATLVTLAMGVAGIYAWRRNRKRKGVKDTAQKETQTA